MLPAFYVAQGHPLFADKGVESLSAILAANATSTAAAVAAAAANTPAASQSGGNTGNDSDDNGDDDNDDDHAGGADDGFDDTRTLGLNDQGFRRREVVPWWRRAELALAMGCFKEAMIAVTGEPRRVPQGPPACLWCCTTPSALHPVTVLSLLVGT
jgi:hypothetical protein